MTQIIAQSQKLEQLTDNIIIFCDENKKLLDQASLIDDKFENNISTYLEFSDFKAKANDITKLNIIKDNKLINFFIVSIGDLTKVEKNNFYDLGLLLNKNLKAKNIKVASLVQEEQISLTNLEDIIKAVLWSSYSFTEWKTEHEDNQLLELIIQTNADIKELTKIIAKNEVINNSVTLTRDLINRPANIVTPEYLANEAKNLKDLGVKVTILDKSKIEKLGLNLLLSVGKGSACEPKLVIMEYYGVGKGAENHAIVGKGITFDTGGYSLKHTDGMKAMKSDMGGAAATLGTIKALATLKTPINVIGVMACAENMVSSNAVKVSDIVKSYNGLTVENMNTDAEGRLVLADAISYTIRNYDVAEVLDIATLTGACMVALGAEYAGVMGYNQEVIDCLIEAGKQSHNELWQLPISPAYADALHSDTADISNVGTAPYGGASTAGAFINKFTENKPWAHLDIAGVAMAGKIPGSLSKSGVVGATGFGVRLLTKYYENKVK
jgi:leucyl aminopeptidase